MPHFFSHYTVARNVSFETKQSWSFWNLCTKLWIFPTDSTNAAAPSQWSRSMKLRYKQRAVIEFPAAGKESVINARKREICALLGYCAAYGGNSLPTIWDKLSVPFWKVKNPLTLEEGTEWFSRNVGNELNYTLLNIPKERRSHLLRGGSLKSSIKKCICNVYRRAMVDTVGRWAKRALLSALTIGAMWAMITAKDYTKINSMKNYTNDFLYNMRHAGIFLEF